MNLGHFLKCTKKNCSWLVLGSVAEFDFSPHRHFPLYGHLVMLQTLTSIETWRKWRRRGTGNNGWTSDIFPLFFSITLVLIKMCHLQNRSGNCLYCQLTISDKGNASRCSVRLGDLSNLACKGRYVTPFYYTPQ